MIKRFFFFVFVLIASIGIASASNWYETNEHPGAFCIPCHQRFSEHSQYGAGIPVPVKNKGVVTLFPCIKPGCHQDNPKVPLRIRYQKHLGICGNCHPQKNGTYEIHDIHLNFSILQPPWELKYPQNISLRNEGVECKLCHASATGYNSTIASVPPLNLTAPVLPGTVIKPPWKNSCAFCHPTVKDAERLHDVHEPLILEACPVCHTSKIFERRDYVTKVASQKSLLEKKLIELKEEFFVVREIRFYFNDIADQLFKVYQSLMKGDV